MRQEKQKLGKATTFPSLMFWVFPSRQGRKTDLLSHTLLAKEPCDK